MLRFRNLDVSPDNPVDEWGFEGILAAVERGDIRHWRRITAAVRQAPRGDVARTVDEVLAVAADSGVAAALREAVDRIREEQDAADRRAVRDELRALVEQSGLDQGQFARAIGTSRTRLNTYLTGRTVPSALVLLRARRAGRGASAQFTVISRSQ